MSRRRLRSGCVSRATRSGPSSSGWCRSRLRAWAPVAGFIGGACGTLFGIGAPPYVVYLTHRVRDKLAFRATLSNMVIFSVSIRAVVFTASGLMLADRIAGFALLVPFALAGLWIGNRIHGRISRAGLLRVVAGLLCLIGLSLLARAFATAARVWWL